MQVMPLLNAAQQLPHLVQLRDGGLRRLRLHGHEAKLEGAEKVRRVNEGSWACPAWTMAAGWLSQLDKHMQDSRRGTCQSRGPWPQRHPQPAHGGVTAAQITGISRGFTRCDARFDFGASAAMRAAR